MNSKQAKEFISALDALVAEKGIDKNIVIEAMETAMANAYKKNTGITNVKATVDAETGQIRVYTYKTVVSDEPVENEEENRNGADPFAASDVLDLGNRFCGQQHHGDGAGHPYRFQ